MTSSLRSIFLIGAVLALASAAATAKTDGAPATIVLSEAPWDGGSYFLLIPLPKTDEAAAPVLRVDLWDRPEFLKKTTVRFTGKEDPGGGPGRGPGRVAFQAALNQTFPERASGVITFKSLKRGTPVEGTYDLVTVKGRKFMGKFLAAWGAE